MHPRSTPDGMERSRGRGAYVSTRVASLPEHTIRYQQKSGDLNLAPKALNQVLTVILYSPPKDPSPSLLAMAITPSHSMASYLTTKFDAPKRSTRHSKAVCSSKDKNLVHI